MRVGRAEYIQKKCLQIRFRFKKGTYQNNSFSWVCFTNLASYASTLDKGELQPLLQSMHLGRHQMLTSQGIDTCSEPQTRICTQTERTTQTHAQPAMASWSCTHLLCSSHCIHDDSSVLHTQRCTQIIIIIIFCNQFQFIGRKAP